MVNISAVDKPFDSIIDVLKNLQAKNPDGDPTIIGDLREMGRRIIEDAVLSKTPGNITGNQIDAYGFGVYYNNKLVAQGYINKSIIRNGRRKPGRYEHDGKDGNMKLGAGKGDRGKWGRMEAMHAIQGYIPGTNGYVLYVTNAMYYSAAHEKWNYPVLSQELGRAIAELSAKYKVNFKGLELFKWY